MKTTQKSSIFGEMFSSMFVLDKHGKLLFFPWGSSKKGYILENKEKSIQIKKFYSLLFLVSTPTLLIISSSVHDFWSLIGLLLVYLLGLLITYYLYTANAIKSLAVTELTYKDAVLENITSGASEEVDGNIIYPSHKSFAVARKRDPLTGIKRFWYRYLQGYAAIASFLMGFVVAGIAMYFHPKGLSAQSTNSLVVFLTCFFWGLGGFFLTVYGDVPKNPRFISIILKFAVVSVMIVFWSLSLWSLYNFVVETFR
jgi:hypothetical protein